MVIWRGAGALAFVYGALAAMLFGGLASTLVTASSIPFTVGIGMILAAIATWFTGIALNRTSPQRKIDAWAEQRRAQLDELVTTGQFSLGPGQPMPASEAEARRMSDELFAYEQTQTAKAMNQHTMFWIPMQYWAFVWAAVAVFAIVSGIIGIAS
ncbi:MAG: hypothetical protein WA971_00500 [Microbacterium sp.]